MVMGKRYRINGFTLIELLVVLAIIATLLSLTMPRYFHSVDKSNEVALRADLKGMRDAIDKYFGDNAQYPDSLDDLVVKKYLRNIPPDPITGSNETWVLVPPDSSVKGKVYDVKSGAAGAAGDGTPYAEW
jgi:general secretion pathway protein G